MGGIKKPKRDRQLRAPKTNDGPGHLKRLLGSKAIDGAEFKRRLAVLAELARKEKMRLERLQRQRLAEEKIKGGQQRNLDTPLGSAD